MYIFGEDSMITLVNDGDGPSSAAWKKWCVFLLVCIKHVE